jgi:hypothetical protein
VFAVLTLYSAMGLQSYFAVMISSGVQITALAWYGMSYIPGGTAGMQSTFRLAFASTQHSLPASFSLLYHRPCNRRVIAHICVLACGLYLASVRSIHTVRRFDCKSAVPAADSWGCWPHRSLVVPTMYRQTKAESWAVVTA